MKITTPTLSVNLPLSRPSGTLSPAEGERDGVRGPLAGSWGNLSRARRCSGRAFTLVELLLVLVILGTLAAIVLPKFTGTTEKARRTQAQTQISTFKTALDMFETDNGYYPKGKSGLLDLIQQPREAQSWHGPY